MNVATFAVVTFSLGQTCLVTDEHAMYYTPPATSEEVPTSGACIPIYLETDKYTYDQFGKDINAVRAWAQNIVTQAAYIYADEGISIYMSELYVATKAEWSDTLNSPGAMLNIFAQVRQNAPNGRIKHFISRRFLGGGIAWINTLCANYNPANASGPYAVSTNLFGPGSPYPFYTWNVFIFAHETGHVIGSRHTHACVWGPNNNQAIDNCWGQEGGPCTLIQPPFPSTIMSYCHLQPEGIDFKLGFGPLPGNLLRSRVRNATCLLSCSVGCPEILTLGGDIVGTYRANEIILYGASTVGNTTLNAREIIIDPKGFVMGINTIGPVFETLTQGCP